MKLDGKIAVVTGGTSGIGLAAAKAFARAGARVVVTGRRPETISTAIEEIGPNATGFIGDVADISSHERLARELQNDVSGIDIYMANAGVNTIRNSNDVSLEEYDAQFATNARGTFFGFQNLAPLIRDGGSIILTSSIASEKVLEGHAVYAGSKAAVNAFARVWAVELKARKIRVNVLSPGPTETPILAKLGVGPEERPGFEAAMAAAIPLGRLARAEELANAALFLASDDSSFITGINLRVDGGMSLL